MHHTDTSLLAKAGLSQLKGNGYPGRVIVIGLTPSGNLAQIYALTGRSEGSKNRRLVVTGEPGAIGTQVADETLEKGDPALTIYDALACDKAARVFAMSNGRQTRDLVTAHDLVVRAGTILDDLRAWEHEPDAPNFTPRISACARLRARNREPLIEIASLYRGPAGGTVRACWSYGREAVTPGYGYGIWTYEGDGNPLPSFLGPPVLLPIESEDAAALADCFWDVLPVTRRAALAATVRDRETGDLMHDVAFRDIHG
jgi:IMP cyclohydrolase